MENKLFLSFLLIIFSSLSFSEEGPHTLLVDVVGAKPNKGQVILSLYSSPESYLNEPLIKRKRKVNRNGQVQFVLNLLNSGTYAVSVIYDEDENNKLNTGFMGIPKELVGFSNNKKGILGPPSFKVASFVLSSSEKIQIILGKAKE